MSSRGRGSLKAIVGFVVLCLAYLLAYFHRVSPAVMASDLMGEFALTPEMFGVFSSVYFYPYMVMQIPSGMMSDRWGVLRVAGVFLLVSGLGTFVMAAARSLTIAAFGRFLVGIGMACVFVPALKFASVGFPKEQYGLLSALVFTFGNLGGVVGSGVLVKLLSAWGWRTSLIAIGAITLVLGVGALLLEPSMRDQGSGAGKPEGTVWSGIKAVVTCPYIVPHFIRSFFSYGCLMAFQGVWGGPYLTGVLGFDRSTAGSVLMMVALGSVIASPVTGYISDNIVKSRKKPAVIGGVLVCVSWALLAFMPFAPTSTNLHAIALLMGIGVGINSPCTLSAIKEMFACELTGVASGSNNFFTMAGGALVPVLVGVIIARFADGGGISVAGISFAFRVLFGMSIVALLGSVLAIETFGREPVVGRLSSAEGGKSDGRGNQKSRSGRFGQDGVANCP